MQGLQEQSELRRKFTIDNDLGRRPKALGHLHALDAFDELKAYARKHELYSQALDLYRYDANRLNEVMKLYADFLLSRNRFKEAGIAYEYLSDHVSASAAYRSANLWRESLSSASLIPLLSSEIINLAHLLADGLVESKDFFAAATIHLDYLQDTEAAGRLFCRGAWYAEAIRIIALKGDQNLLHDVVDAGLVDGLATTTELLADCKAQLGAQVPRLRELRVKKVADPLGFFDGGGDTATAMDVPDNVSIAPTEASTTAATFLTRYTGKTAGTLATGASRRSSKNRRREERKRAAGKKGSIYEEEYLLGSIRRLIERINSIGEEVERLLEGLLRRGMRERARAVEEAMTEVVGMCRGCITEVFEVEDKQKPAETLRGGDPEYRPTGGDGVVWESMEQAWKRQEPPVVKDFQRLSLVG